MLVTLAGNLGPWAGPEAHMNRCKAAATAGMDSLEIFNSKLSPIGVSVLMRLSRKDRAYFIQQFVSLIYNL
jgi:hypothetical protein